MLSWKQFSFFRHEIGKQFFLPLWRDCDAVTTVSTPPHVEMNIVILLSCPTNPMQYVLEDTSLLPTYAFPAVNWRGLDGHSALLPPSSEHRYYVHVHSPASDRSHELDLLSPDHRQERIQESHQNK